ncbi:MAG: tetratricopeptide repeat protein [Armatimonas sp.]
MDELLVRLQEQAIQDDRLLKKYARQSDGVTEERIREIKARFQSSAQLLVELATAIENHIEELELVGTLRIEVAIIQFHSGCFYRVLGDTQTALSRFQEALTRMSPAGPEFPLAPACYANMADILSQQGDFREAVATYEKALERADCDAVVPSDKGIWFNNLAINLIHLEQPEKAFVYFRKAIQWISQSGNRYEEAHIRNTFGIALSDGDQFEPALAQHRSALTLAQNHGFLEQAQIAKQQIKLCSHYRERVSV